MSTKQLKFVKMHDYRKINPKSLTVQKVFLVHKYKILLNHFIVNVDLDKYFNQSNSHS